jgi:beta-1,4-mannosyltransferase
MAEMDTPSAIFDEPATKRRLRVASWPGPAFSANPIIKLLCEGLQDAGADVLGIDDPYELADISCDIIQIHWPEQIFWEGLDHRATALKAFRTLSMLRRKKRAGARIVWLVHNLSPHDMARWQQLVWRYYSAGLCRLIDSYLTLSPSTIATVADTFPTLATKPSQYVWHPAYPAVAHDTDTYRGARTALGIPADAYAFAYVGQIRRYKGIEGLIEAFRSMTSPHVRLLVAGEVRDKPLETELMTLAAYDSRIVLILRSLDDQTFNALTAAADEIVAPFLRYLHSGSIVHALSARKPVLTPATPFSQDLVGQFGQEWVRLYTPPLTDEILEVSQRIETLSDLPIDEVMSARSSGAALLRLYSQLC